MNRLVRSWLLLTLGALSGVSASAQDTTGRLGRNAADLKRLDEIVSFVTRRNTKDYAIATPNGIDEGKYVTIGGVEQWITIRGEDRSNPVILFLHGGPGDATNPYGFAAFRPWLKRFTVVQWDQRGSGRTLGRNGPSLASTITIDRMVEDGIELARLLRTTLKQDKIVLVGHSWGSVLGVLMAKAEPDLFAAYVGTGQVSADPTTNNTATYRALLAEERRRGDQTAVRELTEIGPPPWADGCGECVKRKWANFSEHADLFLPATFALALQAPGYTVRDVDDWLDGMIVSADRLIPQLNALGSGPFGGSVTIPVFVIQGAEDFTSSTSLARAWVSSIRAPRKAFVTIEGGGHFAVFMKPEAFLAELIARVLPLVNRPL